MCACSSDLGALGEAGHCGEYTAEMTGDVASVQMQETMTLNVPQQWESDSSSSVEANFLSVRKA